MKIVAIINGNNGCDYHRILNPLKYLSLEDGEELRLIDSFWQNGIPSVELRDADVVMFNRHPPMENSQMMYFKNRYQFKVIVDVDDYWKLYKDHYLYNQWRENRTEERIINAMKYADIVTCTNDRLATKIKPYCDNVVVIPNAIPFGFEQFTPNRTESTKIRFLYVGGQSHYTDLKSISDVFSKIRSNDSYSSNSEFIMAGYNEKSVPMMKMGKIMSISRNYSTRPEMNVSKYMDHYNYGDVALAPLESNEFNTYKSNLKIIEAGSFGLPIITSKMFPFMEDLHAPGVFLCDNVTSWVDVVKYLIDHPEKISEHGSKLYDYVKEKYNLEKVNQRRRQLFNYLKNSIHV